MTRPAICHPCLQIINYARRRGLALKILKTLKWLGPLAMTETPPI